MQTQTNEFYLALKEVLAHQRNLLWRRCCLCFYPVLLPSRRGALNNHQWRSSIIKSPMPQLVVRSRSQVGFTGWCCHSTASWTSSRSVSLAFSVEPFIREVILASNNNVCTFVTAVALSQQVLLCSAMFGGYTMCDTLSIFWCYFTSKACIPPHYITAVSYRKSWDAMEYACELLRNHAGNETYYHTFSTITRRYYRVYQN